ncbi:hypothetical protein [Marinimicrococcus flavescens]|uniref:Uncharacterized protein n=1 Tax=Marinimicrococcus flavescens TaxID=3031815 RepID=A0AAP3UYM5_9PROT|nr:hypothetical protein [Marinimicrococcus flavescens]
MDYKAVRKHIAEMKKEVVLLKKDTFFKTNDVAKEYVRTFDMTYKAAQTVLKAPKGDFVTLSKETKLETLYEELKGWYTGLAVLASSQKESDNLKKDTLVNSSTVKKDTEIKNSNTSGKGRKSKKVTKIKRGGKREGAGRKSIGVKKHMALTMPQDMWNEIDNLIQRDKIGSYSEFFRILVADMKKNT